MWREDERETNKVNKVFFCRLISEQKLRLFFFFSLREVEQSAETQSRRGSYESIVECKLTWDQIRAVMSLVGASS